ncbi:MAG: hypothetical protein WBO45_25765 [Planctomycetota bacterium]
MRIPGFATVAAAAVVACSSPQPARPDLAAIAPPASGATKAEQFPGLHNVVAYGEHVYSGGVPEGREGLATLAAMGIRTILSVDGATPDVAGAEALGMSYVHLPISYDTVTPQRRQELAQAIVSCKGPLYVHCHHGKHRSAAALASAMVVAGRLTPDAAKERMAVSGTAKEYVGLWQSVAECQPLPEAELRIDPANLPKASKVSGMVATMAEIDLVFDLVKQAQQAGWQPPGDHPDLVPAKETQRLASLFASLRDEAESKLLPGDYQQKLRRSIDASAALDHSLRGNDHEGASKHLAALTKGCKECHVVHRDR